jgi:XXXCH domain-containing protein
MKRKENKDEFTVYGDNSIKLLQSIIDGISKNPVESTTYSIDFERLKKLKISIKKELGQTYLKCKIKYEDKADILKDWTADAGQALDKPDYSVLKKRMKKTFKVIGDRLKNGSIPSNLEMELFCENAELMTTYPGYGDAMYPAFLDLVSEFREAFHQVNIQSCQAKFAEIEAMKKACHHNED